MSMREIFERLTGKWKGKAAPAIRGGVTLHSISAADMESCAWVRDATDKLAAYEDSGLSPARVMELAEAEREGRLMVLPCKVGDAVFSWEWDIKSEKNGICEGRIVTVRYDVKDGSVMVSDGVRFRWWGKKAFSTRAEAEAELARMEGKT
jgi:hypothetical protein